MTPTNQLVHTTQYQCLNCGQIDNSGEDCCNSPDLFKINNMPGEIKRLRVAPEVSASSVGESLVKLFSEALAWGMTYGAHIPVHQWDEMRDGKAQQLAQRAAPPPPSEPAVGPTSCQWLAEMIMADLGYSSNDSRMLAKITKRIVDHGRANAPPAQTPPSRLSANLRCE